MRIAVIGAGDVGRRHVAVGHEVVALSDVDQDGPEPLAGAPAIQLPDVEAAEWSLFAVLLSEVPAEHPAVTVDDPADSVGWVRSQ